MFEIIAFFIVPATVGTVLLGSFVYDFFKRKNNAR